MLHRVHQNHLCMVSAMVQLLNVHGCLPCLLPIMHCSALLHPPSAATPLQAKRLKQQDKQQGKQQQLLQQSQWPRLHGPGCLVHGAVVAPPISLQTTPHQQSMVAAVTSQRGRQHSPGGRQSSTGGKHSWQQAW
jgi:hypothetical protein